MRLIVLGDLHYNNYESPDQNAARDRFFTNFFSQVAAHQADLVIAIGDTTNNGTHLQFAGETEIARKAGLHLVRVMGNHDAYTLPKSEIASYFLDGRPSAGSDGLYTSFDLGNVRFVLLDTTREMNPAHWSGDVLPEQLAWLGHQIEDFNTSEQPYLVAMGHHPITNTTHLSEIPWFNIEDSEPTKAEFARLKRPTAFYVCGHNHSNSLVGPDENGWRYAQFGAPLTTRSYGLFTFEDEGVRFETINIDLSAPGTFDDYESTRLAQGEDFNDRPYEEMYGQDTDHTLVHSR